MAGFGSLTAARDLDSGIVRITAHGPNADAVAEVVNAAAGSVVAEYRPLDTNPVTPATKGDLVVVEVIDAGAPDTGSGRDNLVPIMLATAVLGAILAAAAAVLAQKLSQARDLEARIRHEIGVPVLSVIPSTRELSTDELEVGELLGAGPAPLIEAFQTLRSRIEALLPDDEAAVAISSWQRKEGRTTVTAGLGLALSAVGGECVVVDGSLRKPDLSARLGHPGMPGLAEFAEVGSGELIHKTSHLQLEIVPAGVVQTHPAQILAVALPAVLDAVWERSPRAVVLVDAPPIGPVLKGRVQRSADASTVLGVVRRLMLVIDASTSNLADLSIEVERLQEEGVTVIGAVVNRRRVPRRWSARPARPAARNQVPSPPALKQVPSPPARNQVPIASAERQRA